MSFPDQSHINRVRDALWQRPDGASVMVGSGFSRNAVPVRPNVGTLPTWDQVTNRLHEELYPQEKSSIHRDALRTAQEYEAAFGRTKLHEALRKLVPHEGYNPSPAHQRLLNLPLGRHLHYQLGRPSGAGKERHYRMGLQCRYQHGPNPDGTPTAHREAARLAARAIPADRHGRGLPYIPDEVRSIRQHCPAGHDGDGILPDRVLRRRSKLPELVGMGSATIWERLHRKSTWLGICNCRSTDDGCWRNVT